MIRRVRHFILLFVSGLLFSACSTLQTFTRPASPHEIYVQNLQKSDLGNTSMVQTWLRAGDVALHDSVMVTLPFQETGYFAMSEPQARFYRFDVKDGQVLTLTSVIKTKDQAKLFIDLFVKNETGWVPVEHGDSLSLTHEFEKSGSCLVRLQPELLVNMYYSITLSVTPVLMNPVKGASNKSIGSFYGDARDAGARKHEGIDIFAPKGTPVIAPTDGIVSRVANGGLGGKTVWMNDTKRGHRYYFAHLDSQLVKPGVKVKQGDVLGTVGNTGNARTTPSHLHFGVYDNTSKDPVAYIRTMEKLVNELAPDTLFRSVVFRSNLKKSILYAGPSAKLPAKETFGRDTYLKVIGQSKEWYRVITADEREGFIEKTKLVPAEKGNKFTVQTPVQLLSEASPQAVPLGMFSGTAEGLASFRNFHFIKTRDGRTGWIDRSVL